MNGGPDAAKLPIRTCSPFRSGTTNKNSGLPSDVGTSVFRLFIISIQQTINTLTSKQRAHLRSLAHHLNPVVYVGKEGITPAVVHSTEEALRTRELLKLKVQEGAPLDARESGHELASAIPGADVIQVIGRIVVLYRPFPDRSKVRQSDVRASKS